MAGKTDGKWKSDGTGSCFGLSLFRVVHTKLLAVLLALRGWSDPFPFHSSLHVVPSVLSASELHRYHLETHTSLKASLKLHRSVPTRSQLYLYISVIADESPTRTCELFPSIHPKKPRRLSENRLDLIFGPFHLS